MLNGLGRRCFCTVAPRPWLFVGLGNPGEKYKGTRHNAGFQLIDAFAESQGILMNKPHCKAIFGEGMLTLFISPYIVYFLLTYLYCSSNHGDLVINVGFVGDVPVFLAKPQTYMNLSGESTGPLAAYYKLPLNRVIVFHDEMDLPCGVLRLQHKGGHGRHNGHLDPPQMLGVSHLDDLNSLLCDTSEVREGAMQTKKSYLQMFFWRWTQIVLECCHMSISLSKLMKQLKSVIYHFRGNREFPRLRIGIGRPPGQMDPKAFLLQKFNATAQERINAALQEGVVALKLILSKGLTESARSFNREQKYKHIRLQTMPIS
ncbi:Chloroplastic group IIB intron splicing facilitator CRS2, chloroplastic [Morella rubra]|uniref:Chloroplastic group IIB intron splicing facilitator CRS2, chloroplastic n=1 Tax=Morella rubra TaxID=262757 RepID=A0A6A1VVH8_9ROSI|nr:Chloroplastic group IIB intron splicing facilitator CRS2, chloroplastic [Morella rubra]